MRTVNRMCAQGDFQLIKRSLYERITGIKFPDFSTLEKQSANRKGNRYTIAHSETGHDHVIELDKAEVYKNKNTTERDLYELFVLVKEPATIEHLRSFDTHEAFIVPPGEYIVKRQREYTPEGFRRAAD